MTDKMNAEDWERHVKPVYERHFTPDEQEQIKARQPDVDQAQITREWDALIAEGRELQAKGDPATPEAMDLAKRWMAQVKKFTGDDPGMIAKAAQANMEVLADPQTARMMPFDLPLMRFVGDAYRRAQAAG